MSTVEREVIRPQVVPPPEETHAVGPRPIRAESLLELAAGGAFTEALAGATAVVLAILGLAGIQPFYMLTIAAIIVGVGMLSVGWSMLTRRAGFLAEAEPAWRPPQLAGGLSSESLAGLVGVVLGILALLGMSANVLIPTAVIVFGVALLLSGRLAAELRGLTHEGTGTNEGLRQVAHEATLGAVGGHVLIGLGVVILGILALAGINTVVLTMVALLVLGFSALLSGMALGGRMLTILSR